MGEYIAREPVSIILALSYLGHQRCIPIRELDSCVNTNGFEDIMLVLVTDPIF